MDRKNSEVKKSQLKLHYSPSKANLSLIERDDSEGHTIIA
jgi:hypothetical protein